MAFNRQDLLLRNSNNDTMTQRHKKKTKTFSPFHDATFSRCLLFRVSLCLCVLMSAYGCYKSPEPVTELTQAHQKLKQLLSEEYNINAVVEYFPNTLYVYVPTDFDIWKMRSSKPDPFINPKSGPTRIINFVETTLKDSQINIQYDIATVNMYPKQLGYKTLFSEEFYKIHSNLLSALSRAYSDLDVDQKPIDFVVVMIVDITNGVGLKGLYNLKDIQMVMANSLSQDEYVRRSMSDMIGDENFIENWKGKNLNLYDITWPEFISKQIAYRINFKYGRSDFPPTDSDVNEIMAIINDTVNAYNFDDFETIELNDLASGETFLFNKEQLKTFKRN